MILLQDKPNVNPPDSEFPFGSIRDRDGIIAGTPGNQLVYNDLHQLAEKIIRESTLTPNGVLDSDYNGYQLWDALVEHIKNKRLFDRYEVVLSQSGTSAPTVDQENINDIGTPTSIVRSAPGRYDFFFPGTPFASGNVEVFFGASEFGSGQPGHFQWTLVGSNNQLRIYTIDASGAGSSDGILGGTSMFVKVF